MESLIFFVIYSCCVLLATCYPTTPFARTTLQQDISSQDAEEWLKNFGYVEESGEDGPAASKDLSEAFKRMQRYAGINETGMLDEETKKMMKKQRCGNSDMRISVSKRFNFHSRWSYRSLTYKIIKYPTNTYNLYYNYYVDHFIEKAFAHWSSVADLTFTKTSRNNADIKIGFYSRDHNDGNPFDGPGNTLAHAYFPPDGRLHGDDDERWSYTQVGGPNLEQVMTHEIGHILGLEHTPVRSAVMYAYYVYRSNFTLHQDDINGVVYLYGRRRNADLSTLSTTTIASTTPRSRTTTSIFQFSTMFSTQTPREDGYVYVDKNSWSTIKSLLFNLYQYVSLLNSNESI